jgi:hypothetical protein
VSVKTVSKSVTYQHRANFRKFIATFPPASNRIPDTNLIPCKSRVAEVLFHSLARLADEGLALSDFRLPWILAYNHDGGSVEELVPDEAIAITIEGTARTRGGLFH